MKIYLTTILLIVAIVLIGFGIHTNNLILTGMGGFLVGIYNGMIYKNIKGE